MVLADFLTDLINKLISFLPKDPFQEILVSVAPSGTWLNWLNWVFPVGAALNILSVWLVAVGVWYVWQAVARWLNLIQ